MCAHVDRCCSCLHMHVCSYVLRVCSCLCLCVRGFPPDQTVPWVKGKRQKRPLNSRYSAQTCAHAYMCDIQAVLHCQLSPARRRTTKSNGRCGTRGSSGWERRSSRGSTTWARRHPRRLTTQTRQSSHSCLGHNYIGRTHRGLNHTGDQGSGRQAEAAV